MANQNYRRKEKRKGGRVREKVSVVVVTWNSSEFIRGCLLSLERNSFTLKEVIVVDNGSQDETVKIIKKEFPYVKLYCNSTNCGLSFAINQANKVAKGEYLLLLNPDVVLMEDTLLQLYNFMNTSSKIAICGVRFFNVKGKVELSCRRFPTFMSLFLEFSGLWRMFKGGWKMREFKYNRTEKIPQPMGSCLMVNRGVFNKVGGMDEELPIFLNDVDLCYRVTKLGYEIWFLVQANVVHYVGGSTRKVKLKMIVEEHRSMYRYLKKHYPSSFFLPFYGCLLVIGGIFRVYFYGMKEVGLRFLFKKKEKQIPLLT